MHSIDPDAGRECIAVNRLNKCLTCLGLKRRPKGIGGRWGKQARPLPVADAGRATFCELRRIANGSEQGKTSEQRTGDNGLRNSEWSPSPACTRWDSEKTEIRSRGFGRQYLCTQSVYKLDLKLRLRIALFGNFSCNKLKFKLPLYKNSHIIYNKYLSERQ